MKNNATKSTPETDVFDAKQHFMLKQVSKDFPSKLNHFRKAFTGSLRSAITAKCLECCRGDTRTIRECTGTGCPLYSVRPYQEARINRNQPEKTKAVSAMAGSKDGLKKSRD